jgi:hypothetical protein
LTSDNSLAFVAALARRQKTVLEFGTYRRRTTYNLALNADRVWTVDVGVTDSPWVEVGHAIWLEDDEWGLLEPLMPKCCNSARANDRKIMNPIS